MTVIDHGYATFTLTLHNRSNGEIEERQMITRADTLPQAEKIAEAFSKDNSYVRDGQYEVLWKIDKIW